MSVEAEAPEGRAISEYVCNGFCSRVSSFFATCTLVVSPVNSGCCCCIGAAASVDDDSSVSSGCFSSSLNIDSEEGSTERTASEKEPNGAVKTTDAVDAATALSALVSSISLSSALAVDIGGIDDK